MIYINFENLKKLAAIRPFTSAGKPLICVEFEQKDCVGNMCYIFSPEEWKKAKKLIYEHHIEGMELDLFSDFG